MFTSYIMICIASKHKLRHRTNHVTMPYLKTRHIYNLSSCLYWVTGNYALQGISAWLTAWASIDRYLLIFYHRLLSTFTRSDLPLIIIHVFVVLWYVIITITHIRVLKIGSMERDFYVEGQVLT